MIAARHSLCILFPDIVVLELEVQHSSYYLGDT